MTIDKETLAALPLAELRQVVAWGEQAERDRRCMSMLVGLNVRCTAEAPHEDGWHENRSSDYLRNGYPAHTPMAHPVVIRWRFDDVVVAREHVFEATRRPGAN